MNKLKAVSTDKPTHSRSPVARPVVARPSGRELPHRAASASLARRIAMAGRISDLAPQAPGTQASGGGPIHRALLSKTLQRSVGNARLGRMADPAGCPQQGPRQKSEQLVAAKTPRVGQRAPRVQRTRVNWEDASDSRVARVRAGEKAQPNLTVGAQHDPHEEEADRVAASVVQMPEPDPEAVQRGSSECEKENGEHGGRMSEVQRQEASNGAPEIDPGTESEIHRLRGRGQPLAPSVRQFMEPRFGQDFRDVRIHTGPEAVRTAQALNAQAYTVGQDVMFGSGQYAPGTAEGKKLLAHELAHTVQQRNSGGGKQSIGPGSHGNTETIAAAHTVTTVSRQTAAPPGTPGGPNPCLDLIEAIIALLDEVAQRINDALNDPHDLYKDFREKPHPDYGSWKGHKDRYYYDRDRLREKIAEWESNDDCRGYRLSKQQQEDLKEAEEFKEKEFPEKPLKSMSESQQEEGKSVWDKLRKYLPEIIVGALIAIGAVYVGIAIAGCFASGACEFALVLAGLGAVLAAGISAALRAAGVKDQPSSGPVASSDQPQGESDQTG
jgi:hypothetical protein